MQEEQPLQVRKRTIAKNRWKSIETIQVKSERRTKPSHVEKKR